MSAVAPLSGAVAVRPFVPAKDLTASVRFYEEIGFTSVSYGPSLAAMELGPCSFLLQQYDVAGFAENFMLQLVVQDLDGWWNAVKELDLPAKFGVQAPRAPALQPWGLVVAYLFDPSGVLWHVIQRRA